MWHSTIPSAVTDWFDTHPRMMSIFLAPYSTFLNLIEEFFSTWRWKVFDQMSLLDAMDAACQDITAELCQGWIRHTKRYLAREEDIRCDVDENMWPNAEDRQIRRLLFYLYFILLWLFLFVYFVLSYNKWQMYCIFLLSCSNVLLQINPYFSNSVSVFFFHKLYIL